MNLRAQQVGLWLPMVRTGRYRTWNPLPSTVLAWHMEIVPVCCLSYCGMVWEGV